MRRRARAEQTRSLELLLDTMCNAFGGVMFIAILLAVLSQYTSVTRRAAPEEAGRVRRLQAQRMALVGELRGLRTARAQQQVVARTFSSHPNRPLLAELKTLQQENAAAEKRKEKLAESVAEARARLKALVAERGEREARLRTLALRIQERQGEIEALRKKNVRVVQLPKLRTSRKGSFWMIVRYGRLYVLKRRGRGGPINYDHVNYEKVGTVEQYTPVQGRGLDLEGAWQEGEYVAEIFEHCPPEKISLHFAVFPDSYGAFIRVRDFFVEKGYEHNWSVKRADDKALRLIKRRAIDVL